MLELASPAPVSLDGFNYIIKAMADLMTLCAHTPSGALKRTLWFTGSEAHPAPGGRRSEVEVMGRQVHHPVSQADESALVEYLFTLGDVDFDVVVPAWLTLCEDAPTACSVLFGLKYISQGYASTRLLSAASAAEALHRSLYDSPPYGDTDFNDLLEKVLASCAGKDTASKAARKFIRERLTNHMTYHDRLVALAATPDPEAVKSLIPDVLSASAGYKEVEPMTDKLSQRPVPALDPPERFAGGEVVAAARCPVDMSTFPRRHVIVVKHAGERQTFSVHEVAHNHVEWVGGHGHYDLGYAAAVRLMAEKAAGRA